METDKNSLECQVLDLTIDGPNSVSGLYRDLITLYGYPREIDPEYLVLVLREMENTGLVRLAFDNLLPSSTSNLNSFDWGNIVSEYRKWLPGASLDELSFDKIGLWVEITQPGRESWRNWAQSLGENPVQGEWQAEFDFVKYEVIIASKEESRSRKLLETLCRLKNVTPLHASIQTDKIEQVTLRNGNVVRPCTVLTCKFENKTN